MKNYNTVIFDLDGTLSNSKEGITKSVQYALEKIGIKEENLDSLEHFIGPPMIEELMKTYGFTRGQAEQGLAYYRERYVPVGIYETSLYPGTEDMLKELKNSGKIIAIATSKPQQMAEEVLRYLGIDKYFHYVMGAQMQGSRQSKTSVLIALLEKMNRQDKEKMIMVGDTCFDIDGAGAVGLSSIGVEFGFGNSAEMLEHGALTIVKDVYELKNILLGR